MAKKPNKKAKVSNWDAPMTSAMKFFLAGLVAECYLLIARRYYTYGTIEHMLAWYHTYLKVFIAIGAVALVGGLVFAAWKHRVKKQRNLGLAIAAAGAFLAASSGLLYWNMYTISLLTTIVPVVMLLGILWNLYDRECALSLTVLGVSLLALWVCRTRMGHYSYGSFLKVAVLVYIAVLIALAVLTKTHKLDKLLPGKVNLQPVYIACGLSVVAMVTLLINVTVAYYAMWALAAVVFLLAVYYTVKQL